MDAAANLEPRDSSLSDWFSTRSPAKAALSFSFSARNLSTSPSNRRTKPTNSVGVIRSSELFPSGDMRALNQAFVNPPFPPGNLPRLRKRRRRLRERRRAFQRRRRQRTHLADGRARSAPSGALRHNRMLLSPRGLCRARFAAGVEPLLFFVHSSNKTHPALASSLKRSKKSETDGLSRNDEDCNFGCIDH